MSELVLASVSELVLASESDYELAEVAEVVSRDKDLYFDCNDNDTLLRGLLDKVKSRNTGYICNIICTYQAPGVLAI